MFLIFLFSAFSFVFCELGYIGVPVESGSHTYDGRRGCFWSGRAPFCSSTCLSGEQTIRKSMDPPIGEQDIFGYSCILGEKSFCCRHKEGDSSWKGMWQSATTAIVFSCDLHENVAEVLNSTEATPTNSSCGHFYCTSVEKKEEDHAAVAGRFCTEVSLFGKAGTAVSGLITWRVDGNTTDWWYKL